MYPEPYFDSKQWRRLQDQIAADGLTADPFMSTNPDLPVHGLNLAIAWPLPMEAAYHELKERLETLGPEAYVYPYEFTHVTLMTLVNFKDHQNPSDEQRRLLADLAPEIVSVLAPAITNDLQLQPFNVDVGPPVLAPGAAFLPILNPTGEVARLRAMATEVLGPILTGHNVNVPGLLHSTFLRFYRRPASPGAFAQNFAATAPDLKLGAAAIDQILLTSETKPYMRGGEIIHRFELGEI